MNFDDFRRRANAIRELPLEKVLIQRGAVRDRRDKTKWHSEQGPLSVTGSKFTNWQRNTGGGGAIDLVMHLADTDVCAAVAWLEQHFAIGLGTVGPVTSGLVISAKHSAHSSAKQPSVPKKATRTLRLPEPNNHMLGRVRRYLTDGRSLPPRLIDLLIESGRLYADSRGNAVFLMVTGKPNRPIGAELRGTGSTVWRGMASGTCKDMGYFWIGTAGSREIVICESAIDAISCHSMHPDRICISNTGVRANPRWLASLHSGNYEIHCGFDDDAPGESAATAMIALHPSIKRLRPPAKDWNDALASAK
jgi:hypothetical protein